MQDQRSLITQAILLYIVGPMRRERDAYNLNHGLSSKSIGTLYGLLDKLDVSQKDLFTTLLELNTRVLSQMNSYLIDFFVGTALSSADTGNGFMLMLKQ